MLVVKLVPNMNRTCLLNERLNRAANLAVTALTLSAPRLGSHLPTPRPRGCAGQGAEQKGRASR
jgi:hypothetical protein